MQRNCGKLTHSNSHVYKILVLSAYSLKNALIMGGNAKDLLFLEVIARKHSIKVLVELVFVVLSLSAAVALKQ